jgi:L-2,4-diaminobutyrate decarboxylase
MNMPPLASGPEGTTALRELLGTVLDALDAGTHTRSGPLPAGGPNTVAARIRNTLHEPLPDTGDPHALRHLIHTLAETAADPAHPLCAAHLHCPPLAVATAADLAASILNQSLDSWDQAPGASALEASVTAALAQEVYGGFPRGPGAQPAEGARGCVEFAATAAWARPAPTHPHTTNSPGGAGGKAPAGAGGAQPLEHGTGRGGGGDKAPAHPDALVTTGGTESNHLALLLTRETHGPTTQLIHGANAHHSLPRAAWLLGLPEPAVVPTPAGVLDPAALDEALTALPGPHLVTATAGTTDAGLIDPLPDIAARCTAHGARLHIDAAYGAGLLFSDRHRTKLTGLDAAHTVTLDLHKLGWQPIPAGLLAIRDPHDLALLSHHADYLNAHDDTQAGLPDLLGRSLRTSRRPDILKIAATLQTLGRTGLGHLVDHVCDLAQELAHLIHQHPGFDLYDTPTLSTVLFRPAHTTDDAVAAVRRTLLTDGRAVLGRARLDGRLWLKATLLNPHTRPHDLATLLKLVEGNTPR